MRICAPSSAAKAPREPSSRIAMPRSSSLVSFIENDLFTILTRAAKWIVARMKPMPRRRRAPRSGAVPALDRLHDVGSALERAVARVDGEDPAGNAARLVGREEQSERRDVLRSRQRQQVQLLDRTARLIVFEPGHLAFGRDEAG